MSNDEINQRIEAIRELATRGDSEVAHIREDELREQFIIYVATLEETLPSLAAKAKLILSTNDIDFERWYA